MSDLHELALYGWNKKERERRVLTTFGVIDDPEADALNEANLMNAHSTISLRRRAARNSESPNHGWKYRLVKRVVGEWEFADELDPKPSGSAATHGR